MSLVGAQGARVGGEGAIPGAHPGLPSPVELRAAIERLAGGRPPLLIVSDFDGTLSPISRDPGGARIVPLGRTALRRLARLAAARPDRLRVVVLSGRTSADVAGRVRVGGLTYVGNHGLESGSLARGGRPAAIRVDVDPAFHDAAAAAREIAEAVALEMGRPAWLFVEDKGPSVALHYRQAPDAEAARVGLEAAIAAARDGGAGNGLEAIEGRRVIELRPAGAGGKGTAVERLLDEAAAGTVLVLGDDRSDAEAFAALRAARAAGRVEGVAVAVHGAEETPPEVLRLADLLLPDPAAAARFLSRLGLAVEREPG